MNKNVNVLNCLFVLVLFLTYQSTAIVSGYATVSVGNFTGAIVIEQPESVGTFEFEMVLSSEGNQLTAVTSRDEVLFQGQSIPLAGSLGAGDSFSLASEPFMIELSGRMVERAFTLVGTVSADGDLLQGTYRETITGYTPDPLISEGPFQLARNNITAFVPLNVPSRVAPSSSTEVTMTLLDANGNPLSGESVTLTSEQGTVVPATATTDANGQLSTTFVADGTPGQGSITATCCTGVEQSVSIAVETARVDQVSLNVNAADVVATAADQFGNRLSGVVINLFTDAGDISPVSAVTDANGQVVGQLSNGADVDGTRITALSESQSDTFVIGANVPTAIETSLSDDMTSGSLKTALLLLGGLLVAISAYLWLRVRKARSL